MVRVENRSCGMILRSGLAESVIETWSILVDSAKLFPVLELGATANSRNLK